MHSMLKTVQILEQVLKISKPPYCLGQITYDFSLFVLLKSSALSVEILVYKQNGIVVGPALSKFGSCGGQVDLE